MTPRIRRLLAVLVSSAAIACGPSPSRSPAVTVTASASASAASISATPSPTTVATPSPSPSPAALPQGSEPVTLDPARFAGVPIDHPFWPMARGSRWVYRETDAEGGNQKVEVTVTDQAKTILGIQATVVHDIVTEDGEVVEDTIDWYAQDTAGNLWYLGEDTKEYEGGVVVTTEGSWEAGVKGAQPGIILPAAPTVGMTYRQEYYAGQAEDAAEVLSLSQHVAVPFGTFDGVLQTKDFTPLDPANVEHKFYARGVGPVQVIQVAGGSSREVLLTFEAG